MEINEKRLEKILEKQKGDYQRYIGAISEDFQSKLKVIAEAQVGLQDVVGKIQKQTGKIQEDVEIIKIDIQFIKQELKHKVDRDEFEALEKRVMFLERKFKTA